MPDIPPRCTPDAILGVAKSLALSLQQWKQGIFHEDHGAHLPLQEQVDSMVDMAKREAIRRNMPHNALSDFQVRWADMFWHYPDTNQALSNFGQFFPDDLLVRVGYALDALKRKAEDELQSSTAPTAQLKALYSSEIRSSAILDRVRNITVHPVINGILVAAVLTLFSLCGAWFKGCFGPQEIAQPQNKNTPGLSLHRSSTTPTTKPNELEEMFKTLHLGKHK